MSWPLFTCVTTCACPQLIYTLPLIVSVKYDRPLNQSFTLFNFDKQINLLLMHCLLYHSQIFLFLDSLLTIHICKFYNNIILIALHGSHFYFLKHKPSSLFKLIDLSCTIFLRQLLNSKLEVRSLFFHDNFINYLFGRFPLG